MKGKENQDETRIHELSLEISYIISKVDAHETRDGGNEGCKKCEGQAKVEPEFNGTGAVQVGKRGPT